MQTSRIQRETLELIEKHGVEQTYDILYTAIRLNDFVDALVINNIEGTWGKSYTREALFESMLGMNIIRKERPREASNYEWRLAFLLSKRIHSMDSKERVAFMEDAGREIKNLDSVIGEFQKGEETKVRNVVKEVFYAAARLPSSKKQKKEGGR